MMRIDERTVELTDLEMIASDYFDRLLDRGYGIAEAVETVKIIAADQPDFTDEFWDYLSE
jgi:hypothetical protein